MKYLNLTIHKYKHLFEKFQFIRYDNTFKLLNQDLFESVDTQLFWESHIQYFVKNHFDKNQKMKKNKSGSLCQNTCGVVMFFTYEPQDLWGC
jgi:hypothetical protein